MTRIVLLLALMAGLCMPAPASAASVSMLVIRGVPRAGGTDTSRIQFAARPSERNVVTIQRESADAWLVSDSGAPLTVGDGCVAVDESTARCTTVQGTLPASLVATVFTDDLDDSVTLAPPVYGLVRGGSGNDTMSGAGFLAGGPGDDSITGSPGPDSITGGPGADVLRAGAGDDALVGGGGTDGSGSPDGDDDMDGGAGEDTVSYKSRRAAVFVDLADARPDGSRGERDRLRGVENIFGGDGADILRGDAHHNEIDGGAGRDLIDGRAGPDRLDGGAGADLLRGGSGADALTTGEAGDRTIGGPGDDQIASYGRGARLDAGPGNDQIVLLASPRSIGCGAGIDTVFPSSGRQHPLTRRLTIDGCESVRVGLLTFRSVPARAPGGSLHLRAVCPPLGGTPATACRGEVTLMLLRRGAAPIVLGSRSFVLRAGKRRFVGIAPGPALRRALDVRRHPLLEVRVKAGAVVNPRLPTARADRSRYDYTGRWRVHLRT